MDLDCDLDDEPMIAYADPPTREDGNSHLRLRVCAHHASLYEAEGWTIRPIASP
jgi:hypothetical protein